MRSEAQLTALALVALGSLLGAGVQFKNASLILVYPFVATALAFAYAAEDRGIQFVGYYVAQRLEKAVGSQRLNWEHFVGQVRGYKSWYRNSVRFLFVATELLALFLAIPISKDIKNGLDLASAGPVSFQLVTLASVLFVLGATSAAVTFFVLRTNDKKVTTLGGEAMRMSHALPEKR